MERLRASMDAAIGAMKPGQVLTTEGQALKENAALGAKPAEEFRASRAAGQLRAAFEKALQAASAPAVGEPATSTDLPPILAVSPIPSRQRDVSFSFWLWTLEDKRIKVQLAAAIAFTVLVAGLAIREHANRGARAISYAQLTDAVTRRDYAAALDAAETFLSSPVLAIDARSDEVRRLYAESLVRWFTTHPPDSAAETHRLGRYRSLVIQEEKGQAQ